MLRNGSPLCIERIELKDENGASHTAFTESDGMYEVALPAGLIIGSLTGFAVGRWYRKGGRLPEE